MAYYHACPYCACNLDPGETCDCSERAEMLRQENAGRLMLEPNQHTGATRRITIGEIGSSSASRAALPRR